MMPPHQPVYILRFYIFFVLNLKELARVFHIRRVEIICEILTTKLLACIQLRVLQRKLRGSSDTMLLLPNH